MVVDPAFAHPPSTTFISERFIPLHIIIVKIIPEAPTSAPAIIKTLFPKTNPVIDPAKPEYEFSKEIATGISAPPIGSTNKTPSISETPVISRTMFIIAGNITT